MKHLTNCFLFLLTAFLLSLDGCIGNPGIRLAYCAVGSEEACADLREAYKPLRRPVSP